MTSGAKREVTIRYSLTIQTVVEESGDYMGEDATLAEHWKKAEEEGGYYRVFLQKGGGSQQEVRSRVTVDGVTITPRRG